MTTTPRTKLIPDGYWLIWSNEHNAYCRPNRCGYTHAAKDAGRYTAQEANKICEDARPGRMNLSSDGHIPPEMMVPAPELVGYFNSSVSAKAIVRRADKITAKSDSNGVFDSRLLSLAVSVAGHRYYPDWLFDGYRVYQYLSPGEQDHGRTSAENVSDVLDAIHRLIDSEGE